MAITIPGVNRSALGGPGIKEAMMQMVAGLLTGMEKQKERDQEYMLARILAPDTGPGGAGTMPQTADQQVEGAAGVVNAMPFNCMPGTVVSALSKTVADDLGGVPWLNISYEGLRDSGEDTRLEAFADQVRSFHARSGRTREVAASRPEKPFSGQAESY